MTTRFATGLATDQHGEPAGEAAAATAVDRMETDRVDFCQVFCTDGYDYEAVLRGVRSTVGPEAALVGCSAAETFTEDGVEDDAVAVALVASDTHRFFTGLGTDLRESVPAAVDEAVAELPDDVSGYPYLSGITLHDGLDGIGEELALTTKRKLGPKVTVVGGTAADGFRYETTPVFHDGDVVEDAVVLALVASKSPVAVSVGHGHEPISEAHEVTKAEGRTVYELDGRPAYEVWKEAVREPVRETLDLDIEELDRDDERLPRIMGSYGFGLDQGGRYAIRQMLPGEGEGDLFFTVEIPEGVVLRVMHGTPDGQIEAARRTAREARETTEESIAGAFVYDCSCRKVILGEEFPTAVDAMVDELDVPLAGLETYGEMCLDLGAVSGYHNTSTVVMLLPE